MIGGLVVAAATLYLIRDAWRALSVLDRPTRLGRLGRVYQLMPRAWGAWLMRRGQR